MPLWLYAVEAWLEKRVEEEGPFMFLRPSLKAHGKHASWHICCADKGPVNPPPLMVKAMRRRNGRIASNPYYIGRGLSKGLAPANIDTGHRQNQYGKEVN
jgi:hypothetical protein